MPVEIDMQINIHPPVPQTGPRLLNAIAASVYQAAFLYVYTNYISIEHATEGMYFRPIASWETMFIFFSTATVAYTLPLRLLRPSSIILWFIYCFFYVPTLPLTLLTGLHQSSIYVPALLILGATFVMCALASQMPLKPDAQPLREPGNELRLFFIGLWIVMTGTLLVRFRDIISFSAIDDIYYQRQIASESSAGDLLIGYVRTYYNYVVNPALAAFGLVKRRKFETILGIIGLVLSYSIDAMKINFAILLAILIFSYSFKKGYVKTYTYTLGLAGITVVLATAAQLFSFMKYFVDVLLYRSIAIPGQTFPQYYDLFSEAGYTFWSNVRGLHLLIPAPAQFARDPDWPNLGLIVGQRYFYWVKSVNVNANLFAGEGIAAAGPAGIAVIGVALAIWLRLFDLAARSWKLDFVILITVPMAMALSNVHLSTLLLSFGGAFWTAALYFYRPRSAVVSTLAEQRVAT